MVGKVIKLSNERYAQLDALREAYDLNSAAEVVNHLIQKEIESGTISPEIPGVIIEPHEKRLFIAKDKTEALLSPETAVKLAIEIYQLIDKSSEKYDIKRSGYVSPLGQGYRIRIAENDLTLHFNADIAAEFARLLFEKAKPLLPINYLTTLIADLTTMHSPFRLEMSDKITSISNQKGFKRHSNIAAHKARNITALKSAQKYSYSIENTIEKGNGSSIEPVAPLNTSLHSSNTPQPHQSLNALHIYLMTGADITWEGLSATNRAAIQRLSNPYAKKWNRLTELEKIHASYDASYYINKQSPTITVKAFTLNLTAERQLLLIKHPTPAKQLADYINRNLRNRIGHTLPLAFHFDVDSKGNLHIHGIFIPQKTGSDYEDKIAEAFRLAGGGSEKKKERLFQIKSLNYGSGWYAYTVKNLRLARATLNSENLSYLSDDLRQISKAFHEQFLGYENKELGFFDNRLIDLTIPAKKTKEQLKAEHEAQKKREQEETSELNKDNPIWGMF